MFSFIRVDGRLIKMARSRIERLGQIYMLGERGGVIDDMVVLDDKIYSGGGSYRAGCVFTPYIHPDRLDRAVAKLYSHNRAPAGFLRTEPIGMRALSLLHKGRAGDFQKGFPMVPVITVGALHSKYACRWNPKRRKYQLVWVHKTKSKYWGDFE